MSFFGDSSSRNSRYMVAGGFAVAGNRMHEIEDQIATLRDDAGIRSEFHWADYRGGNRRVAYENLVDYAFDLVNKRKAALHLIIAKFEGYDHKSRAGDTKDTSVNRMYYQLCLHRLARFYGKARAIHVRLDAGHDCKDICGMRNQLCADAYRSLGAKPNCIRSIEPVDSKNVGIIQMADVIVGAVAAKQNEIIHKSAKGDLADYVLRASGRHSWAVSTPASARFLTVWHHKGK
ncbi:MAG: DUF3800 domain-containing protein [Caulobacteraceae bacterium]|nr:DUF3800 domain-containing protein [Caulobacteraceae bacterium]